MLWSSLYIPLSSPSLETTVVYLLPPLLSIFCPLCSQVFNIVSFHCRLFTFFLYTSNTSIGCFLQSHTPWQVVIFETTSVQFLPAPQAIFCHLCGRIFNIFHFQCRTFTLFLCTYNASTGRFLQSCTPRQVVMFTKTAV